MYTSNLALSQLLCTIHTITWSTIGYNITTHGGVQSAVHSLTRITQNIVLHAYLRNRLIISLYCPCHIHPVVHTITITAPPWEWSTFTFRFDKRRVLRLH